MDAQSILRNRFKKGEALNIDAMKEEYPQIIREAFNGSCRGWYKTLSEAGIDPYTIRHDNSQMVTCHICGGEFWALAGHLRVHGIDAREYRKMFGKNIDLSAPEIRQTHSRMEDSIIPHWEMVYSPEYTLDRIIHVRDSGKSINFQDMKLIDRQTVGQALKYFGSWDNALEMIEERPEEHRKVGKTVEWSVNLVIEKVRKAVLKNEALPNNVSLAARKRFGSVAEACRAAGVDRGKNLRYSPREIEECRADAEKVCGKMGRERVLALKDFQGKHLDMIRNKFGNLKKMATAFDLPIEEFETVFIRNKEDALHELRCANFPALSDVFESDRTLYRACKTNKIVMSKRDNMNRNWKIVEEDESFEDTFHRESFGLKDVTLYSEGCFYESTGGYVVRLDKVEELESGVVFEESFRGCVYLDRSLPIEKVMLCIEGKPWCALGKSMCYSMEEQSGSKNDYALEFQFTMPANSPELFDEFKDLQEEILRKG